MVTVSTPAGPGQFHGKFAEEEFQFCFHQHWIRMALPAVRMLLLTLLVLSAGMSVRASPFSADARHLLIVFLVAFLAIIQFEFLEKLYNYFLYIIIVTDRRIHRIKKTLFITNDQQSIDLWVLQDINESQHGLMQCGLGFGSLILESQETTLKIHFVPRVSRKYEQLVHLREQARRKWPNVRGQEEG